MKYLNLIDIDMNELKLRVFKNGKMYGHSEAIRLLYNKEILLEQDEFIIVLFTGLKDKDEISIYEGDIVMNGLSGIWIVTPLEGGSMGLLGICKEYKDQNFIISALNQNAEVIGNIHEHPELLK